MTLPSLTYKIPRELDDFSHIRELFQNIGHFRDSLQKCIDNKHSCTLVCFHGSYLHPSRLIPFLSASGLTSELRLLFNNGYGLGNTRHRMFLEVVLKGIPVLT